MFGALRLVSVQRGLDPRDFALVAFGGAGPLHGNSLSKLCGSYPCISPPTPGVLSALGFLHSDIRNEFSQTIIRQLEKIDNKEFGEIFEVLGGEATAWLNGEEIAEDQQKLSYQVDVRYYRQGFEFPITVSPQQFGTEEGKQKFISDFKELHEKNYGFNIDSAIEIVNLRCVGIGQVRKIELPKFELGGENADGAIVEKHTAWFDGKQMETNIYDREKLGAGNKIGGPAIVTQKDSTTVILPDHHGKVDAYLNILIYPNN
jgi:N-methylhydantoinase A